ncbi:MAG: ABC transporter permease, partial [Pseudohongiellaceae bacterium]
MQKSSSFFIATRYILAKKDNRLVSVTSLISMAGLTLGVLSLIIVLSVFNGSQGIMRDRTLITVPHGDIFSDAPIPNWQAVRTALENHEEINSVSPFTRGEAMLSDKGYHQVSEVKGIIPEAEIQVSTIEESMISGSLDDLVAGQHGIVIGLGLATNLRLGQGDSLNLIVPEPASANFNLQMHRFTVVGIFDVQFDIGANLALIHIQDSREVFAL